MKLFLVLLDGEVKATHTTERAAKASAKSIREGYWPEIQIVEIAVRKVRLVKTMRALPARD